MFSIMCNICYPVKMPSIMTHPYVMVIFLRTRVRKKNLRTVLEFVFLPSEKRTFQYKYL